MFTTSETGKMKFLSMIEIWSYIRLYNPSGNFSIFDENGNLVNRFILSQNNSPAKQDLFTSVMKTTLWKELMKHNKIENTFGTCFERYRLVKQKTYRGVKFFKIFESQNFNKRILQEAYYPQKDVMKYSLQMHEWNLQI